jgi:hypothetical protein
MAQQAQCALCCALENVIDVDVFGGFRFLVAYVDLASRMNSITP